MDLVISNLQKSYNDVPVLRDFCAVFPEGETSVIMGPSGCGKTTLLNILMGLLKADGGTIEGLPEKIACVFQEDRLCESFSAVMNVRLACVDHDLEKEEINRHLSALGLADSLQKPCAELSGGMKRRVAICRAMLAGADLIILDEPFKGLDEETHQLVMDYVMKESAGKTVILVTHDPREADELGGTRVQMTPVVKEKEAAGAEINKK